MRNSVFKDGAYFISINTEVLEFFDGRGKGPGGDYSSFIKDFTIFSKLGIDAGGDLIEHYTDSLGTSIFRRYPVANSAVIYDEEILASNTSQ